MGREGQDGESALAILRQTVSRLPKLSTSCARYKVHELHDAFLRQRFGGDDVGGPASRLPAIVARPRKLWLVDCAFDSVRRLELDEHSLVAL